MAETPSDIISKFPDEILTLIVSKLPIREMLATGLLSRRWRNLWTQVPDLAINLFDKRDQEINLFDDWEPDLALSRILRWHSGKLDGCLIFIAPYRHPRWIISLLTQKGVTKLGITYRFYPNFCIDVSEFLSLLSLQHLSLTRFYLSESVPQATFGLRSLVLARVILPSHSYLNSLISNIPHLERLIVSDCCFVGGFHDHEEISISAQMLKLLEIKTEFLSSLKLNAPALTTLRLHQFTGLEKLEIVVPSIRTLIITGVEILDLFNKLYQLNFTSGSNRLNCQEALKLSLHSCNFCRTTQATSQNQNGRFYLC